MRENNENLNVQDQQTAGSGTEKKLKRRIAIIVALVLCLLLTTIVLAKSVAEIKDNYYHTGIIKINLNDGKAVLDNVVNVENGKPVDINKIEPGMTLKAPFFIENQSTFSVYYRLYFENVSGDLADVLEIEIREKTENGSEGALICSGTANELKDTMFTPEGEDNDVLEVGQKKYLMMYIHFPEEEGNESQAKTLEFSMAAEAVQTKNNPDKQYK